MIIEWKCPKYWNIDLDKLKADGKDTVIIEDGQIVGKIISIEERNNELYAKVEIPDKSEKELNDYFTEKTKKYVIYTDENFRNDAKKIVLDIGKETDIIQRKMEREVQEYSKTMDSLMKRYTSLNKEISEIEENHLNMVNEMLQGRIPQSHQIYYCERGQTPHDR